MSTTLSDKFWLKVYENYDESRYHSIDVRKVWNEKLVSYEVVRSYIHTNPDIFVSCN